MRNRGILKHNWLFMEAVLWIVRTGSPWRDLPERFGDWSTTFRRFRDWRAADVFKRIFDALSDEPDLEYAMVDATIVKVHRHGQGAKIVISQHPGRAQQLKIDTVIYTWRHLIEDFSCKLKEFKRIAMRTCKTDRSFEAMIYLAAAVINAR